MTTQKKSDKDDRIGNGELNRVLKITVASVCTNLHDSLREMQHILSITPIFHHHQVRQHSESGFRFLHSLKLKSTSKHRHLVGIC
jgi:hypothetical protein